MNHLSELGPDVDCSYPLLWRQNDANDAAKKLWTETFIASANGGSPPDICLANANTARENYLDKYYPKE